MRFTPRGETDVQTSAIALSRLAVIELCAGVSSLRVASEMTRTAERTDSSRRFPLSATLAPHPRVAERTSALRRRRELPRSEWSIDYDGLDHERDDECRARSTSPRRSSGSCVRPGSCWARRDDRRGMPSDRGQRADLLSVAQEIWRAEDRSGSPDEGSGEGTCGFAGRSSI